MDAKARSAHRGGVRAYQQDTPTPGGGTPTEGQPGGSPPSGGVPGLPLDVLPEALRGKSEAEIRSTLDSVFRLAKDAVPTIKTLQAELEKIKREPPSKPAEPEKPRRPISDRLLDDKEAEEALDEYFAKRAGPALKKIEELESRVSDAQLASVRSEVPDFDNYEGQINEILESQGLPRTKENVLGAYTMALGLEQIEARKLQGRKATGGSETPTPEREAPKKAFRKTALSEEIRTSSGLSEEDFYQKFSRDADFNVKVPT